MELKGTRDWSDFDAKDGSNAKSNEASKQPLGETAPERRAPVFDLGIIYNRKDMPPEILKPVTEEHDRVAPEVAQGLTLGTPELSNATGPSAAQQAKAEADKMETIGSDDDDESGDSEKKEDTNTAATVPPKPIRPPLPVSSGSEAQDFVRPVAAEKPQDVPPIQNQAEATYYPPPTPAVEALTMPAAPPAVETTTFPSMVPEQTPPVRHNIPVQPTEFVPPPTTVAGSGGNMPPPEQFAQRPYPEPERGNPLDVGHSFSQPAPQSYNRYLYQQPNMFNTMNVVSQRTFENAQEDLRRKFAARMILAVALTWYLTRRPIKPLRKQVSALQETTAQQNEQITNLTYEQQAAQRRISEQQRQIEQFTQPQAVPFGQEFATPTRAPRPVEVPQTFAEQPPEVAAQKQELAGSYNAVFNAYNHRPAPEATIPRGQEYQQDRSHELVGARDARFTPGAGSAGGYGQPMASFSSTPTLPSGQSLPEYMLPMNAAGQTPNQEAQHLLNAPKVSPAVAAITSPWLWLGVGILLIAFFVAATI